MVRKMVLSVLHQPAGVLLHPSSTSEIVEDVARGAEPGKADSDPGAEYRRGNQIIFSSFVIRMSCGFRARPLLQQMLNLNVRNSWICRSLRQLLSA